MKAPYSADFGDNPDSGIEFQEAKSLQKRLEPANPVEYVEATGQTLRDKQKAFNDIQKRFLKLTQSLEKTGLGLARLRKLTQYLRSTEQLQSLEAAYHNILVQNRGFSYDIDKCQRNLREVSQASEFIGTTLKNPLADRYKKVAAQQELGLRLDDIDAQFKRCNDLMKQLEDRHSFLTQGIEKLLNETKTKVPPAVQENLDAQAKIEEIALEQKNKLQSQSGAKPVFRKLKTDLTNVSDASKKAVRSMEKQGRLGNLENLDLLQSGPGKALCLILGFLLGMLVLGKLMK